jgi:DNA-directed RNA polymerase subunit E'/Rpb7
MTSNISYIKDLYIPQVVSVRESLLLSELNSDNITASTSDLINAALLKKVINKVGGKCMDVGYIDKNSINILTRTIGKINTSHFNGEVYYHVQIECLVCKPMPEQIIEAKFVGKNKIGILCVAGPLQVIIPFSHHEDASFYNDVNKNDKIAVKVINYKFQLNDDHIKVIGKFVQKL